MISRAHLSTLLLVAAILWAILLLLDGTSVSLSFFSPFSTVLGVLVIVISIFDKWLWRLRLLHPWFVPLPNIEGTWTGQLASTWVDARVGAAGVTLDAELVIRQTFSSIHLRLSTPESNSELLSGNIVRKPDGTYQVVAVYRNTPRLLRRDQSPIHYGGVILDVMGGPPGFLEGEYWTDRGTRGELRFSKKQ